MVASPLGKGFPLKLLRSAVLMTAALAVPLVPTAAHADKYTHADGAGDVYSSVGQSGTYTPAPDRVIGDVLSSTIQHKRRNVVMRLQYRDLVNDSEYDAHVYLIHTSKMNRVVNLYASNLVPGGRAVMTKPNGKRVSCHIGRKIDYDLNTATVVVPRSCLGEPRWVKVAMGGVMFTGAGATDTTWLDDALSAGTSGVFSPRVRR